MPRFRIVDADTGAEWGEIVKDSAAQALMEFFSEHGLDAETEVSDIESLAWTGRLSYAKTVGRAGSSLLRLVVEGERRRFWVLPCDSAAADDLKARLTPEFLAVLRKAVERYLVTEEHSSCSGLVMWAHRTADDKNEIEDTP